MDNREEEYKAAQLLKGFSDTPQLDARFLTEDAKDEAELASFIQRRQQGEPVFKILGHRGFWSLDLKVSYDTLDPRPDSETLIETILRLLPDKTQPLHILDLGTGTGCLLLALLSEYSNATGVGIDVSEAALKIARENGEICSRASFLQKDWNKVGWTDHLGTFDVVISNPPYIPTEEISKLDKEVREYDPKIALDGGIDGLDAYRRLVKDTPVLLEKGGLLVFEIGTGQEKAVLELAKKHGFEFVMSVPDLNKIIRCLVFKKS